MTARPARAIVAVAAILLVVYVLLWAQAGALNIGRSDFASFYVGGTLLRVGHAADLYSQSLQGALHSRLIAPDREGNLPFVNSPIAAAVVLPVTLLGLDVAYRVWSLVELAVLVLAVLIAARSAPWPATLPRGWRLAACAAALASTGTWTVLMQAQWTPVLALGLAFAFRDFGHDRLARGSAILVFAAAVTKPHLALGLLAFLIGWRRRRILAGACTGAAAALMGSLALVGPAGVAGFVSTAAGSTTRWRLGGMLSFVGIPGAVLGDGRAALLIGVAGSAAACLIAWRLGAMVRRDRRRLAVALCGATVLSLLAAPHAYSHDLVMLSPAVVWATALAAGRGAGRPVAVVLGVWASINAAAFIDISDGAAFPPGQLTAWALMIAAGLGCVQAWKGADMHDPAARSGAPAPRRPSGAAPRPTVGTFTVPQGRPG